jgi:hypothetical protein
MYGSILLGLSNTVFFPKVALSFGDENETIQQPKWLSRHL